MLQVTYRYPQDSHHNLGNTMNATYGEIVKKTRVRGRYADYKFLYTISSNLYCSKIILNIN